MLSFEQIKEMDLAFLDSGEKKEPLELTQALIERYPFLAGRSRFTGELVDHTGSSSQFYYDRFWKPDEAEAAKKHTSVGHWTELSELDRGWRKVFGIEICEDIRTVLLALGGEELLNDYRITQIKEKWASMRWYSSFASDGKRSRLRLDGFGPGAFRGKVGDSETSRKWLTYVEEFYSSLAGHICIKCGSTDQIRRTDGWIIPVCCNEERWESGTPYAPPKKDEPFCVWKSWGPDGERVETSYKDMVVGADAPIIEALGLDAPLHATEIWERVAQ